jgi:ribosomal protein S18 acetylase RimI-like enzyme
VHTQHFLIASYISDGMVFTKILAKEVGNALSSRSNHSTDLNMKEQGTVTIGEKVAITQLTPEFAVDLIKHSYFGSALRRGDVLNHGLRYRALKAFKLFPRATRLVAYHTEKKNAIGFLYLEENTKWLYTIEYVFVDSKYRRMGLATELLKYAMKLAKEKGAKKVNLNVASNKTRAIDLYKSLGFKQIGSTLLVQGYLLGPSILRLIKRAVVGQGCLTRLALERKGRVQELQTKLGRNKEKLFGIYKSCVDKTWVDFFEISSNNLIEGSRHIWQPPFFKDVLIDNLGNSFALIFNRPFSSKATVELYSSSNAFISSMFMDLLKILAKRGTSFVQIHLFNPSFNALCGLFEEKGMTTFHFVGMGKTL